MRNIAIPAMGFVVGVRLLWFAVATAVVRPLEFIAARLPETDWFQFERLKRFRDRVVTSTLGLLPAWIEHHDSGIFKIQTTKGMAHLDAAVDRIPERVIDKWSQFGMLVIGAFLVAWGAILLALLAAAIWLSGAAVVDMAEFALAYDWASLLESDPTPTFDLHDALQQALSTIISFAIAAAVLFVLFLISIVVAWVLMLPLMPGLLLHEFGHYAAIRKADATVENYGLLLFGPYLAGAFVDPSDDTEELGAYDTFAVWSGGIANTVIWGVVLIAGGLVIGGDPLTVLGSVWENGAMAASGPTASSLLILIGALELMNGFLNAVPVGPVDGGGFIRSVEEEWWGLETPLDVFARGGGQ